MPSARIFQRVWIFLGQNDTLWCKMYWIETLELLWRKLVYHRVSLVIIPMRTTYSELLVFLASKVEISISSATQFRKMPHTGAFRG